MASLVVKPRARIFHGHDWVYASEIAHLSGDPEPGGVITLKDQRGRPLGSAIYNPRSQIVARRFSRQAQGLDLDFFRRRIGQAVAYRQRRGVDLAKARLVWSESDGLPGVIVDRYGDALVLQTLTLAMDQRKDLLAEALRAECAPRSIVERNDAPVRKAEGLEPVTGLLWGEEPGVVRVENAGVAYEVDLREGHKTGLYLDQLANHVAVAGWAPGRRVLDCFAHEGGFALACAKAGATAVEAVEIGEREAARIGENARRNGLAVEVHCGNAFDFLKRAESGGAQYDLVVLDPPSFTRSKDRLGDALRGYKEIHLRALRLLSPSGLLATFCCSHHVGEEDFRAAIVEAIVDAKRSVRLLQRYMQPPDHPVLPHLPETEYLKGFLFEAAPGR